MRRYPKRGGQFAIIWVDLLYEDSVPQSAKILFGEIYRLSDADGYCDASNKDFMELLGCSENTVRNLLKALVDVGQIRIEMMPRRTGAGGTDRRIFCARKLAPLHGNEVPAKNCGYPEEMGRGTPKNLRGVPAENCGDTIISNLNNTLPQIDLNALFDRFWQAYPKKRGKQDARRAWAKLNPSMELCRTMSAALIAQKQSEEWKREGGRFVPYPATWLNGRRWEDEIEGAEVSDPNTEGGYIDGL